MTNASDRPPLPVIKINFQPDDTPLPDTTFIKDVGQAFEVNAPGLSFGWVREDSLNNSQGPQGISITNNARKRKRGITPQLNTLIHLQHPTNGTPAVAWQCKLNPGEYIVTLSVGDPDNINSVHQINIRSKVGAEIESKTMISAFQPQEEQRFRTATEAVVVGDDGLLTIDAKGGTNTKLNYIIIESAKRPFIRELTAQVIQENQNLDLEICDGAMDVPCNVKLTPSLEISPELQQALGLSASNPGVEPSSGQAAKLFLVESLQEVKTHFTTSGGGDTFTLTPEEPLRPHSHYRLQITSDLKSAVSASDNTGFLPFLPKTIDFTTGEEITSTNGSPIPESVKFEQVSLPTTTAPVISGPFGNGETYTGIVIAPDGKLYAGTLTGRILRFSIQADGTLGAAEILNVLPERAILGLCVDPGATSENLILWVSHNAQVDMRESEDRGDAPDWSGAVSRLSGTDLKTVDHYITGLPRSVADHVTTGIAFNPKEPRVLYVLQGSNTAMGVPGGNWKNRPERLLSAALLKVDLDKAEAKGLPVQVRTEQDPGSSEDSYDPFATNAPVTIHATGFRSPYDMVFHSNGKLYVTNNGSAKNYLVPDLPDGRAREVKVPYDDRDSLFRVEAGGYYGHPNPQRNEWIMNGGNPGDDQVKELSNQFKHPQWQEELKGQREKWMENPEQRKYPWIKGYPSNTNPESHWKGYAHNFGLHASPTGLIEYQSDRFNGALKGKLIAVCFNNFKNLAVLIPGNESQNWNIVESALEVSGFTNLDQAGLLKGQDAADPLDLIENPATGDLYITKLRRFPKRDSQSNKTILNFGGEIVLLRPIDNRTNS